MPTASAILPHRHGRSPARQRVVLVCGVGLLIALAVLSLFVGAAHMDLSQDNGLLLLTVSRIPRTLAAILAGAALSVAGVVIQQTARNKFVEPGTIGTTESAALGLLLITATVPEAPIWTKMIVACLTALAGTLIFNRLIRHLPRHEILLVPLAGLVLSGVIGAVATFIAWQLDLMQFLGTWMYSGEFSGVIAGRYELLWFAAAAAVLAYFTADRLTILGLGPDAAQTLGVDPKRTMRLGLIVVAVVSAIVVVTVGMIPFVGLIVPNIASRLQGDNLRQTLPSVALGGGIIVLACDLIGRTVIHPYEIAAGTILGALGAIVFLYLLWRGGTR